MNPVLKRTLSGLTAGLLVVGLFLYCPLRALMPIVATLAALAQLEFYQMAKARYEPIAWLGVLMGVVWMAAVGVLGFNELLTLVVGGAAALPLVAFALCAFVTFSSRYKNPVGTIASTLFGFLYVPFLMSFFLLMAQVTGNGYCGEGASWVSRTGLYTLFALIAVTKFSDTGGFAFGMAFGKHKMCPSISPKKSWEGLAGSMLFSAVVAAIMLAVARHFNWGADIKIWNMLSYPAAMAGGAFLAIAGTAGDLIESRFKREFGVKDSATFMPAGQGGFLDMFDSILFIPAIAYPLILIFNR